METTWKNRYCKLGKGSLCCKYLVTDGESYECNKLVAQPETMLPLPDAAGDNCVGVKKLALVEQSMFEAMAVYEKSGGKID